MMLYFNVHFRVYLLMTFVHFLKIKWRNPTIKWKKSILFTRLNKRNDFHSNLPPTADNKWAFKKAEYLYLSHQMAQNKKEEKSTGFINFKTQEARSCVMCKSLERSLPPARVIFEILSEAIFPISKKKKNGGVKGWWGRGWRMKREKIDQYLIFSAGDMFRH